MSAFRYPCCYRLVTVTYAERPTHFLYSVFMISYSQGVKKVLYKKKFSSSCYWASTFGSPDVGLVLLFTSGKIEIR